MKISVFIPVYNGEKFIGKTMDCVLGQSYEDLEVLCVDDSSNDNSFAILSQYAEKDHRVKVFRKENGGDVPHSWQFITPYLLGDFTMYMSQDDMLDPNTIEKLVARQKETGADAVIPTVVWFNNGDTLSQTRDWVGVNGDTSVVLSGKDAFELMMDYSISGFAIWRTQLIKNHPVETVSFNSDEYSQRDWCSRCNKVAFSEGRFYYSQNNPNAITKQFSEKFIKSSLVDGMIIDRAHKLGINHDKITDFANKSYKTLWFYTMWFVQRIDKFDKHDKKMYKESINKAYEKMHNDIVLAGWKFKHSSKNVFLFWVIVYLKLLKARIMI